MINYSIAMRGVNANLFEINQAKSRMKAAEAKGETPSAADVALVQSETLKAFAVAQVTEVMPIEKFARHIADHGCVYSRADISAILYLAVDCMREMLLEGRKVRLGDLGDFSVSLSSKGAESADKFSAANITAVKVQWDPGQLFKNLISDAEFNLVATRAAQAAMLRAIKTGESVALPDGDEPDDPSGDTPSGGSGTDGGGSSNVSPEPGDNGSDNGGDGGPSAGSGETEPEQIFIGTSVNDSRMGSVTGMGTYDKGTTVTLKATANAGYRFVSWGDDVTENPRVIKAEVNGATYSAIFEAVA